MPVTTNTRKLAALLGASGAGIGTDGLLQAAAVDANIATQAELDAQLFDDDKIQTNLALLAFKAATNGSLAKYNLQDQIVDEFVDATGVNTGDSTYENLTTGVYRGSSLQSYAGLRFRYMRIYVRSATYHDGNAGLAVATFKDESAGTPTHGYPSTHTSTDTSGQTMAVQYDDVNSLINASTVFAYTAGTNNLQYVDLDFGAAYVVTKLYIGKKRMNGDANVIQLQTKVLSGDSFVNVSMPNSGMTYNATQGGTAFTFSNHATAGYVALSDYGTNENLGYSSIEGGSNWTHQLDAPSDLILQSSDTTAEAAPTKADMIMLIEDVGTGVGTVNTHIKGWVSRYETGGTKTWTQGTLVDEGDWGTDKRILAFHDLTLTGTSGTQMAYKITTHSSSAVYDTRIHATSIGWR